MLNSKEEGRFGKYRKTRLCKPKLIAGKYEILREIGRGGMGIVYEAVNRKIGKKVALKKLKEELSVNPWERKRFLEEAQRVAELHHPNIVDIYDIAEENREIYLVFEYAEGRTIEEILNEGKKFNVKETCEIGGRVAKALEYAHGKKIIHRDIKPSNIMVGGSNKVKVMDFGIAREAKETMTRLTGVETPGTLAYMSPEQHVNRFDERSDIYSVGVTMYEMLTGEVPFKGPDYVTPKREMVYKKPSEIVKGAAALEKIIVKCLQAEPEKRYQSAEELKTELKNHSNRVG